jgi:hypothetical protein
MNQNENILIDEHNKKLSENSYRNILKPLGPNKKFFKFISFDIETYSDENKFLFGSCYDGINCPIFWNREEMIEYLLGIYRENTYIVATNLSFDFNALFIGTKYYSEFEYILANGKMIMAKWHMKDDNTIVFIDTMNFAGFSVYTLGKIINLPKAYTPVYIGKIPDKNKKAIVWIDEQNNITKELEEDEVKYFERYNKRDSEITYGFINLIQKGVNELGGCFKFTVSSTALDIFRRNYQDIDFVKECEVIKEIDEKEIKAKIFESYYGGRTEAFARGYITNKKLYDINSLYPWCMTQEFPDPSSAKYISNPDDSVLENMGISNVNIKCPYMKMPLLPYRDKEINKLIFPTGKFIGTFTHYELNYAIKNLGYKIHKINWSIIYTKTFYPFKNYVIDIYNRRMILKKQDSSMEIIFKLFLNSLYGKFGQKDFNEIKFLNMSNLSKEDYAMIEACDNMSAFDDLAYLTFKKESKSNFLFPIFCAYVTSYGRVKLYKYITEYDSDYCDTDSIVTDKNIQESNNLGEMKLEATIKEGILVKPKFYSFNFGDKQIYKIKGVKGANQFIFDDLLHKKKIYYKKFIKMKEAIKHKMIVNSIYQVEKIVKLNDNKRIWKNEFNPYIYDNESEPYNKNQF